MAAARACASVSVNARKGHSGRRPICAIARCVAVRVEVDAAAMKHLPYVKLYPGMPVDVSIVTGERTMLAYIVQPLVDSFAHAFREE